MFRYGNLPKEVPTWFGDLDGDQDGQVGLYEWRKAERVTKEFVDMDLNGDCYLTAEEWIRYNQLALERKPTADGATDGGRGGSSAFGGRDRGGSSGRPSFGGGAGGFTFSRDRGGDRGNSGSPPSFGDRGSRDGNSRDGGRDRGNSSPRDGGSRDGGSRDGGERRGNPFTGR